MAVPRRFLTGALVLAAILVAGAATWGMQASGALQPKDVAYDWALPRGFPQPKVPENNPMSRGKVSIGHRLFYDVRLSGKTVPRSPTRPITRLSPGPIPHSDHWKARWRYHSSEPTRSRWG